jgi:hypothetical protein
MRYPTKPEKNPASTIVGFRGRCGMYAYVIPSAANPVIEPVAIKLDRFILLAPLEAFVVGS